MKKPRGKTAAECPAGDDFIVAAAAFEKAKKAFVKAAPGATQFNFPADALNLLTTASDAMDAMMRIEAPSTFALAQKLIAVATCPWSWAVGDYADRLAADAGNMSLQFARIWLERWKSYGGYVTIGADGRVGIGHPSYSFSPQAKDYEARADEGNVPPNQRAEQRSWHSAFYDGKVRELWDLAAAVPGTLEAVKAIVEVNQAEGIPSHVIEQEAF